MNDDTGGNQVTSGRQLRRKKVVLYGDRDGVVVIPAEKAEACLEKALEIEAREQEQTRYIQETKSILKGLEKYKSI